MFENNYSPKVTYGIIKKIIYTQLAGLVLFLFVALLVTEGATSTTFDLEEALNLALIVFTVAAIPMGSVVSRKVYTSVKPEYDSTKRMGIFQKGMLIRLASYESVGLFSIVVFILTANILVLLFAAISIIGIITSFPRPSYVRQTVGVNEAELI